MSRRRVIFGLIGAVVLLFLLIQLIPVWLVESNPPVTSEPPWDSPRTRALAQRACFDCHSNQTTWPLYSRIAPVSWLITWDVVRGRDHLNWSEWNTRGRRGGGEGEGREGGRGEGEGDAASLVQRGEMPPWYYLTLHPDARLTDSEKQELIQGLQATMGGR